MMKTWRSSSNKTLWARPIYEHEWPKLIQAMKDDGLLAIIQSDGVRWYVGGYKITDVSVCDAWGLKRKQMDRLKDYILVNDPFLRDI